MGTFSREDSSTWRLMSWFHLTVGFDSPLVVDLKAEATSASDRLRKIGERVGLASHVRAHDFFSLADPMSRLLIAVESETFNEPGNMLPLYAKHSPLRNDISEIINSWSSATGRNIKAESVTASPARALPPPRPRARDYQLHSPRPRV